MSEPAYQLIDDVLDDVFEDVLDRGLIDREPARDNLTDFKQRVYNRYLHAPHLALLDRHLEQITRYVESGGREGIQCLIVEMPPRHGKSLTVSQYYPTWHIGRNPDHRVMIASYQADLARKFSRKARNLIASPVYRQVFPGVALAPDRRAVEEWDLDKREGGMNAVGVLSGATGKGAHILSCDDLIAGRADAESPTIRDRTWDAFIDDLLSRLEPNGAFIVTATRWHLDDPTGRILQRWQPSSYVRLNLKALIESQQDADSDPLGRKVGEALWPARYPVPALKAIRDRSAAYSWSSLYQQSPTPAEGGLIKRAWFEPALQHAPPVQYAVRYWDLAMSERTTADYTVGWKTGLDEHGHRIILDVARGQIDWENLTDFMAEVMIADGPNVAQGIEQKGYMSRAIQALNSDGRLRGYTILGYDVDKDKVTRALPAIAKAGAGMYHMVAAHWNDAWIDEAASFPLGAHDDQVDAWAGAEGMIEQGAFAGMGEVYIPDDNDYISGSAY